MLQNVVVAQYIYILKKDTQRMIKYCNVGRKEIYNGRIRNESLKLGDTVGQLRNTKLG
jgi:hypothetical protein